MTIRIVCLALATAALAAAATEAHFGLLGITALENARLNAYCDGSVAPNPCAVTLTIYDINGRTLKQATLTLQPNTSGFMDFAPPRSAASRIEIVPCFDVLRGAALVSVEVFDSFSERTRLLINWGDRSIPRAEGDFAPAGITPFDTARVGAVCEGDGSVMPPPCEVTLEFHDSQGNLLKQSRMTLQPGMGGFLDLTWAETRSPSRRVEIQPCFKVARGAAVGTLTIVDNFFGLTLAHGFPAALVSAQQ